MAITIKELLAADTIASMVDKVNFNFDQLMLNGGGPPGPPGGPGPPGPLGPTGIRGARWFHGLGDPNSEVFTSALLTGDYYLQATTDSNGDEGDVWQYNAITDTWTNTGINLQGPSGSAADSIFDIAGNSIPIGTDPFDGLDFAYIVPDSNLVPFMSTDIRSLVIGGYPENAPGADPGNLSTIDDFFSSLNPSNGILYVNSPNTAPQIVLSSTNGGITGTGGITTSDISEMSSIESDTYDVLRIKNKRRTDSSDRTLSGSDFSGIYAQTLDTDIDILSARDIRITAQGAPLSTTGGWQPTVSGSVTITSTDGTGAPFVVGSALNLIKKDNSGNTKAYLEIGPNGTNNARVTLSSEDSVNITSTGNSVTLSSTSDEIYFISGALDYNFNGLPLVTGLTLNGLVIHDSTGRIGSINFDGSFTDGVLSYDGTEIQGSTGTDNTITRWDGTTEIQDSMWTIDDSGHMYPDGTGQTLGTLANPIGTIYMSSVIDYASDLDIYAGSTHYHRFDSNGVVGFGTGSDALNSDFNLIVDEGISFNDATSGIKSVVNVNTTSSNSLLVGNVTGDTIAGGSLLLWNYTLGSQDAGDVDIATFTVAGGSGGDVNMYTGGSSGDVNVWTGGNGQHVILQNDGNTSSNDGFGDRNVGIKTYNPGYPLDVFTEAGLSTALAATRIRVNSSSSNQPPILELWDNNSPAHVLKFYVRKQSSGSFTGLVSDDSAIAFNDSPNTGGGIWIGKQNYSSYLRLGGQTNSNVTLAASSTNADMWLIADRDVQISAGDDVKIDATDEIRLTADTTGDATTPGIQLNGENTSLIHASTISATPDTHILTSGRYVNGNTYYNWTRVGNVVTCIGRSEQAGGTTIFSVPIGNGGNPAYVVGNGICDNGVHIGIKAHSPDTVEISTPFTGAAYIPGNGRLFSWNFSYVIT